MDPAASTSRLSAFVAFGVQWTPPPGAARAEAADDATARAAASRIVDVKAQRVDANPAPRKNPVQPLARETSNIFLSQAPVTTYAPPLQPGQGVRLVQFSPSLGQNFDAWA